MEHFARTPQGTKTAYSTRTFGYHIGEHCLTQVVNNPTRLEKTLHLLFTNVPSLVNRVKGMAPIGKVDHDIVYIQYDMKAKNKTCITENLSLQSSRCDW